MILSIIIFIFSLIVLVLIHELGHFLMAKKFGIKVEEFGIGIPPRAWGKKIGETLYSLNWIPYGGFVRLLGEDEIDKKVLNNPRSFAAHPVWQRIIVVVAGVAMNLLLAWILFYIVLIGQDFKIIYPSLETAAYIGHVEDGYPAKAAGIRTGEQIVQVDGQNITEFEVARQMIKAKKGDSVKLTILALNGHDKRELEIVPKQDQDGNYLIGVAFSPVPIKSYETFSEKLFSGITYSFDLTKVTFVGLGSTIGKLIGGDFKTASASVAGPVGIANVSNSILKNGWDAILPYTWFVGVISLTLAIFNVLPIPALDGGRLFFLIIEGLTRKKVKAEIERIIHSVGFAVLLFLAALITFSDIHKLFPK